MQKGKIMNKIELKDVCSHFQVEYEKVLAFILDCSVEIETQYILKPVSKHQDE